MTLISANQKMKDRFDAASAEKQIVSFIRKTVQKANATGVVLGLSGGIDSAVVAALSSKALGPENVFCFFFHTGSSYRSDLNDALSLNSQFEFHFQKVDMNPVFQSAKSVAAEFESGSETDSDSDSESKSGSDSASYIFDGNLKSRLRMSLLYNFANKNNLLVIGTKNKTELVTGYFTKFGDGGVDFEPIAGLYKTEVRLLAKHLGLPENILTKTPSAGFFEGQSDEADLGISYEELDAFLLMIEKSKKGGKIGKKKEKQLVKKSGLSKEKAAAILGRIERAKHKQKMPGCLKLKK
ncbi:NH(3)-dependent NAD(+) synthetase [Methanosarcinaceae archaeon Ag5]|uniref:NH(3)-dependent NAD(+) synthetase n=1 Tax=Methanolapillus africanus TaxID=3028297 RepID=A0AAE4SDQ5_9EURY|nr:NH(3)-dependent NAD(+) synthetase [Methanosarcinaceae archaeon Ag5]